MASILVCVSRDDPSGEPKMARRAREQRGGARGKVDESIVTSTPLHIFFRRSDTARGDEDGERGKGASLGMDACVVCEAHGAKHTQLHGGMERRRRCQSASSTEPAQKGGIAVSARALR